MADVKDIILEGIVFYQNRNIIELHIGLIGKDIESNDGRRSFVLIQVRGQILMSYIHWKSFVAFEIVVFNQDSVKPETSKKQNTGPIIRVAGQNVPIIHKVVVFDGHSVA